MPEEHCTGVRIPPGPLMETQEYDYIAKINYAFAKQKLKDYVQIILYCLANELDLTPLSEDFLDLVNQTYCFEHKILI